MDVALVWLGQDDGQVAQALAVRRGDPRSFGQELVEARELGRADRAEEVGETVVETGRGHVVAVAPAVVAQAPHGLGDAVVVGRDGPTLARRDDLAGMEREAGGEAERAAGAVAPPAAERTGGVLDQRQVGELLDAGRTAEEMHGDDRAGARADLDLRRVDVHRLRIDVDEDGPQTGDRDHVGRRREGVGGHQDLVARVEPEREHREVQRRRPGRDGDGVPRLARLGERGLELRHARTHRQHAALEHPYERVELLRPDVGPG